jgi:hypothetical protein
MQRKRTAGKVATQQYVQPDIVSARVLKTGTRDLLCYEHAYYTSEAKNHQAGSNEYMFEYEGSWRTRTGELVFGVRGLYLKKCPIRMFSIGMKLFHLEGTNQDTKWIDTEFQVDYAFNITSRDTVADVISELNDTLYRAWAMTEAKTLNDLKYNLEWRQNRDTGYPELYWKPEKGTMPEGYKWMLLISSNKDMGINANSSSAFFVDLKNKISAQVMIRLANGRLILQEVAGPRSCCCCGQIVGGGTEAPPIVEEPMIGDQTVFLGDPVIVMWDREDILIRASFVQQTQNQHLGYTGIDYNTPKKYQIIHNSPQFTISLWSQSTLQPVELPRDNRDYVVMECVVYRDYNL